MWQGVETTIVYKGQSDRKRSKYNFKECWGYNSLKFVALNN